MALLHRWAASRECGPVRAVWSMRACARAGPPGPGMKDPACHATPAPCVHSLTMREDGQFSTPLLYQRAECLALLPGEAARRGGGGGRGEGGRLLACIQHKWSGARWRRATSLSLHATEEGEHSMYTIRRILFVVALSIVVSMTPIGLVVRAPVVQPFSAPSGHVQDTSTPLWAGSAGPPRHTARPRTGARKGQAE